MIELKTNPTDRVIELGGGDRPRVRPNVDCRPGPNVDLVADFNKPLPLESDAYDGVFSQYALEHVSWRKVRQFLSEVCRILKPGAKAAFVVPDTEAQLKWVLGRGWEKRAPRDGMAAFEEASCCLFGDQDYPENSHKAFLSPGLITELLKTAGFDKVNVTPYGECLTDMVVEAVKPAHVPSLKEANVKLSREQELDEEYARRVQADALARERNFRPNVLGTNVTPAPTAIPLKDLTKVQVMEGGKVVSETSVEGKTQEEKLKVVQGLVAAEAKAEVAERTDLVERAGGGHSPPANFPREQLFDKAYFNGGGKVGGYAREGYWDFPAHEVTARHVLARKPESVLELGCARGYVLKRLEDVIGQNTAAGHAVWGVEVSKHCHMTRVTDCVTLHDLCQTPWPVGFGGGYWKIPPNQYDLCFSIATLEHVPEEHLPAVIREMARTCKRGLHGIDFGHRDDGFDKTHCTLKPKEWWDARFAEHAPGWPVEVLDKEDLEKGDFPKEVLEGDGRLKLNVGSFTTMFHHGWVNIDQHDLAGFANAYQYKYLKADVRQGLPFGTGVVDAVYCSHFLNCLTYAEATAFLRDCRRVIRPDGALRVIVPDAKLLVEAYRNTAAVGGLGVFDEINDNVANAPTAAVKLWALLHDGQSSCWDAETLLAALDAAGFHANDVGFRKTTTTGMGAQVLRETLDPLPCLSLFAEAHPRRG